LVCEFDTGGCQLFGASSGDMLASRAGSRIGIEATNTEWVEAWVECAPLGDQIHLKSLVFFDFHRWWLGRQDSNLGMAESKSFPAA
jgi:hypothetical protein